MARAHRATATNKKRRLALTQLPNRNEYSSVLITKKMDIVSPREIINPRRVRLK
ncbi:hypothetical protein C900_03436 [Fulvivirga imtechensis AK7]|uniref:Uncharacterized protein n=1 Tax=Fulvivirga imtechensis AK7 TaxID=1237149 RepID=L8JR31_9BACT|nr:hypothetical protein C900_03436 [Fulvivirga imtechensis AK7]